jgi:hypothetical protein
VGDTQKNDLIRSLGKVVRGLSALFWSIPLALITYIQTARTSWLDFAGFFSITPALFLSGVQWYSLFLLRQFQPQERIWQRSVEQAELLVLVNMGLIPFLYWWRRCPKEPLYGTCVVLLVICCFLLLIQFNRVIQRLVAMLPDEALRSETFVFTNLNTMSLWILSGFLGLYIVGLKWDWLPSDLTGWVWIVRNEGAWIPIFLMFMPVAITMALIWKIKEIIFSSVFDSRA